MIINELIKDLPRAILHQHKKEKIPWLLKASKLKEYTITYDLDIDDDKFGIRINIQLNDDLDIHYSYMYITDESGVDLINTSGHSYNDVKNKSVADLCDILYDEMILPYLKNRESELKDIIKEISPGYYRDNNLKNLLD